MTKGEIIDYLEESLPGGGAGGRYERPMLREAINVAMNDFIFQLFKNTPHNYDLYKKSYTLTLTHGDRYAYSRLPVSPPQLPSKAKGVTFDGSDDRLYIPATIGELSSYRLTDFGVVNSDILYIVVDDTIRLYGLPDSVESVVAMIVTQFSDLDDDDKVHLPSGVSLQMIESAAISAYGRLEKMDKSNDSNPDN